MPTAMMHAQEAHEYTFEELQSMAAAEEEHRFGYQMPEFVLEDPRGDPPTSTPTAMMARIEEAYSVKDCVPFAPKDSGLSPVATTPKTYPKGN